MDATPWDRKSLVSAVSWGVGRRGTPGHLSGPCAAPGRPAATASTCSMTPGGTVRATVATATSSSMRSSGPGPTPATCCSGPATVRSKWPLTRPRAGRWQLGVVTTRRLAWPSARAMLDHCRLQELDEAPRTSRVAVVPGRWDLPTETLAGCAISAPVLLHISASRRRGAGRCRARRTRRCLRRCGSRRPRRANATMSASVRAHRSASSVTSGGWRR